MTEQLPWGMDSEIELTVTLKGDLDLVMADLRRLRETAIERTASIAAAVYLPPGRRRREAFTLPPIRAGDAALALDQLDRLVRQRRLGDDQEHRLDAAIRALQAWTRRP